MISTSTQIWIAIAIIICAVFYTSEHQVSSSPDSLEYIQIAESIADGSIINIKDTTTTPFAFYHRSPLYCLLLALLIIIWELSPNSIIILHLLITISSLFIFFKYTSTIINPLLISIPLSFLLIRLRHGELSHFFIIGTQWPALLMILMWIGLLVNFIHKRSDKNYLILGLCGSLLILLRSALSCFMISSFILSIFLNQKLSIKLLLILTTLLPVLAWSALNIYRFKTAATSPSLGWQIATIGAIIGGAPNLLNDTETIREFKEYMSSHKFPQAAQEEAFFKELSSNYSIFLDQDYSVYTFNFSRLHEIRAKLGLTFLQMNSVALNYGLQSIRNHFDRYTALVLQGISESSLRFYLFICQIIILAICLIRRQQTALLAIVWLSFLMHLLHIITCSLVQLIVPDYYNLTLFPYLICTIIFSIYNLKEMINCDIRNNSISIC